MSTSGSPAATSAAPKGGWKAAIFIILVEMAERFSFYGITSGLISYLTEEMGDATATAAKNINLWQGVAFVCPLFGAIVADSLLGRFRTALFSSLIYLFGLVFLFLSTLVIPLKIRRPFFYVSLYILAIGEGGHKPSVQTFAADQFEESTAEQKAAKSSFFNWWYLGIVTGALLGIASVFVVQKNVGWAAGFGIPTAGMAVALAVFLIGVRFYRREPPPPTGRSPFTRVAQVVVASARKRGVREDKLGILAEEGGEWGPHVSVVRTKQFRFLDKAMVIDEQDAKSETKDPWRLCTLKQVEEVKQVLRLLPIWFTCYPYSIVYAQLFTFFTKQANTMESPLAGTSRSHLKLPTPYIPLFVSTTLMLGLIVLYDRAFVPFVRKLTSHPTGISTLQRIGIGQFLSMAVMIVSALVERKRVNVAYKVNRLLDDAKAIVPLSVWWLLPQYMVMTVAEVFAVIGMQELFYDQMPSGLRSLGAAAYLILTGIGSFVSSGVIAIVQAITSRYHEKWLVDNLNEAHLDGFYWVLSVLCGLGFCAFVWTSSRYKYKEIERVEKVVDDVEG